MTYYKPLTPELRRKTLDSIGNNIRELETCQRNALANMQIKAWEATQMIIKGLPDGYPMPIEDGK